MQMSGDKYPVIKYTSISSTKLRKKCKNIVNITKKGNKVLNSLVPVQVKFWCQTSY